MISYSWHYKKPLVDRMYKYLIENGHDVWKDDEGTGSRTIRPGPWFIGPSGPWTLKRWY